VVLYGVRPEFSRFRIPAGIVGVIAAMLSSLTIYHAITPGSFSIEALIFPNSATLQGFPLARMSPVTATVFLLGGLSLVLLVSSSGKRTRSVIALSGIIILSCGAVTSIGYLYQAPLLYGSPMIPVSIPAGIAFLFLGTEIWAAAGRECWPTRNLVGDSVQAKLMRAFLPVVTLTFVVLLGLDQTLPDVYVTPLLGSLELVIGLAVVIIVIGRLSRGIGGEIDQSIIERERLRTEIQKHSLHLEEMVEERTRKLQESEERYRDLFEACPVSLWEEDFSAVKEFLGELRQEGVSDIGAYFASHPKDVAKCAALVKVLNVNEATLNLYNAKSVDEIIGLSGVVTEKSNRAFVGELVALAQGKTFYEVEMDNRTLRGETKHCNVICAVVPGYEQTLGKVLVCIVDLTSQKKLEAELVKSQRLAAIGETAAMVGHDLRNPLQAIAGASYNIGRNLGNDPDLSSKEMLTVIDGGVQYANGIINDLLEFSREMQLQPVPTTPKSMVRQALTGVRIPKNIMIEDATTETPEMLADEPKLRRVLTNLIENAIDAMPKGGKLLISSINNQEDVSIFVRDTGTGISKEAMEKIWIPLNTTKAKGIGLGLAICRRIVEAHGGSISFESTVGKGTTFTLKLPIQHIQPGGEPL